MIPLIIYVLRIRRNILFFNIKVLIYSCKLSNDFYSFAVLTFYNFSFLLFWSWFQPPFSRFPILLLKFNSVSNLFFLLFWLSSPLLNRFKWISKYPLINFTSPDSRVITCNNLVIAVFEKRGGFFSHSRIWEFRKTFFTCQTWLLAIEIVPMDPSALNKTSRFFCAG